LDELPWQLHNGTSEAGSKLTKFTCAVKLDSLFGWLVCEEILLADLCKRKILFRLEIYDRL